jgi:hypothetical protein
MDRLALQHNYIPWQAGCHSPHQATKIIDKACREQVLRRGIFSARVPGGGAMGREEEKNIKSRRRQQ